MQSSVLLEKPLTRVVSVLATYVSSLKHRCGAVVIASHASKVFVTGIHAYVPHVAPCSPSLARMAWRGTETAGGSGPLLRASPPQHDISMRR